MASSIFGRMTNKGTTNTNMLQKFAEFKKSMEGKNAEQIVRQMLADGRMTQQEFESLKQQAQSFMGILR